MGESGGGGGAGEETAPSRTPHSKGGVPWPPGAPTGMIFIIIHSPYFGKKGASLFFSRSLRSLKPTKIYFSSTVFALAFV